MTWFLNLKIATKLMLSFTLVAAAAGVIGWTGLSNAQRLSGQSRQLYEQRTVGMRELDAALSGVLIGWAETGALVMSRDPAERRRLAHEMEDQTRKLEEALDAFGKASLAREEEVLVSKLREALPQYLRARGQAMELALKMEDGPAIRLLHDQTDPALLEVRKSIRDLIDFNARAADEEQRELQETAAAAGRRIVAFLGIGLALTVGLGILLAHATGGPLRMLTEAADKLAAGDVDVHLSVPSKDELGSLARSLRGIADMLHDRAAAAQRIAAGDVAIEADTKSGHDMLAQSFHETRAAFRALQSELARLTSASHQGQLSERGKPEQFQGAYAGIVKGVNEMLDAILLPVGEGHRVLRLIRGGNLRERVEIACKGDHEQMKEAINGLHGWLAELIRYATKIANGDMTATMVKASDQDQVYEWLVALRNNTNSLADDTKMLAKAASEGKLGVRADPAKHQGEFRRIIEGFNATMDTVVGPLKFAANQASSLASSAEELTAVSGQMANNAEETATQANAVSAASEQVSKNVTVVSAGSDQMQTSIREISKSANEAARVAKDAVGVAENTNNTIAKLGESSVEIGKVIKVITSIAQQTNLLALNATIEAARAGEAGKGFAVVANEVKELAKETAKATEEIGQKIEAIQSDTKGAVAAIGEISSIINQINDISNNIASAVEEQTVTTNEIGRNVGEAAKGTGDIAKNIGGVALAAQNTTRGAADTQRAAQALSSMAVQLQALVLKFTF